MPFVVAAGGEAVDTGDRSIDRQDRRIERNNSLALQPRLLGGLALIVLIAAVGTASWVGLFRDHRFAEPSCPSAVLASQRSGCVAAVPIQDIAVAITATVGLTPDGSTLLFGGPLRSDKTKVVLAGLNVADRRETWRTPLDGFGPDVKVSISANGDKAAVWGAAPRIRVVNVPGGTPVIDVPVKTPYTPPFFDVSFSEDGGAIQTGDAPRRRIYRLSEPPSEPTTAAGFGPADACRPQGQVGQSNTGSLRSRDGKAVVLLPTIIPGAPIRIGEFVRSQMLSEAICGTSLVAVLDAPADWSDVSAGFSSFSPRNDRLAVVYVGKIPHGEWRTLIEIWDTGSSMKRLAAFPIRGSVGYRIGWSQDAHRFAAIRSTGDGTDALIYAIP
jgi:hypothetical protein